MPPKSWPSEGGPCVSALGSSPITLPSLPSNKKEQKANSLGPLVSQLKRHDSSDGSRRRRRS